MFPTLYKKDTKNNIRQWSVRVENEDNKVYLIISTGLKGKKLIDTKKEITEGKLKLKDKPYEYACILAERKLKQQVDRHGYSTNIDNLVISPMLAHNYNTTNSKKQYLKRKHIKFPCAIQPKLDGIRCIANDKTLLSRKNKKFYNLEHIENSIQKLNLSKSIYLDGELYCHNKPLQDICSLVRQVNQKPDDVKDIEYHIYDCFDLTKPKWSFKERFEFLSKLNLTKPIVLVKTDELIEQNQLDVKHSEYIQNNYEGAILRNYNSFYKIGYRSNDLQKYKHFDDTEYKIIGFTDGENEKECVIWQCVFNDKIFNVRPRGTIEERKKLYLDGNKYIGKMLTVRHYGKSKDELPCFPVGITIRDYE